MSRNGSGTYNLPAGNPVVSGTTITSSWANTTMQNIADALTQSVASDGQTPMSSSLNMANNKIVSVLDPTNAQDAATKAYTDAAITTAGATYLLKASNLSDVASATTSRTNLSAAKSGANSDITSITGLTTALTVAQGGTGAATHTSKGVLIGNGTSAVTTVSPSTSGNVLTSDGTSWTSVAGAYALTSGTAVASTSGTSIDFTSIPSWVKRITVMFNAVSTNGTSLQQIQLGTGSTTFATSGYAGASMNTSGSGLNTVNYTSGLVNAAANDASAVIVGQAVFTNISGNIWIGSINCARTDTTFTAIGSTVITLGAVLTGVRVTTINGTDTFDAGSINILYE